MANYYVAYFKPTTYTQSGSWYKPLIGDEYNFSNGNPSNAYDNNGDTYANARVKYGSTAAVEFKNFENAKASTNMQTWLTNVATTGTTFSFMDSIPNNAQITQIIPISRIMLMYATIGPNPAKITYSSGNMIGINNNDITPTTRQPEDASPTTITDTIMVDGPTFQMTGQDFINNNPWIKLSVEDKHRSPTSYTKWYYYEIGCFVIFVIPVQASMICGSTHTTNYNFLNYNDEYTREHLPDSGYDVNNYNISIHMGNENQIVSKVIQNNKLKITYKGTQGLQYTVTFNPITYTISYDLNGGETSTSNKNEYIVETDSFTLTNPTKPGYTFKGWSGTGLTGDTNKTVTISKGSTGNRTYTANWTPITYTISYTLNGSNPYTVDTISNPVSYNIETNTITLNNPTRKGYTFKGWSGTGLTGDTNKNVTIPKGSTGNKTYTANWTKNQIHFRYWSNNRTEQNNNFVTWNASPDQTWPYNHWNYTLSTDKYYQFYPGFKGTGYYYVIGENGTKTFRVQQDYSFNNYLKLCETYGVSEYEKDTTFDIYCEWTPEILVSYDTIFNYFDWYRNEIKPDYQCSIISQNENEFTIKSNTGATDGYSKKSPVFDLAKEIDESGNLQVIEDYIIEVNAEGSGWELFIFFLDDNEKDVYYPGTSYHHTNISRSGAKITIPPGATKAQIRVDSNASENQVTFSNFRIYPAKYYYMGYTVLESERIDRDAWSLPTNPTRRNNFYKFKGWSKDPGLNGKDSLVDTSSFPEEDTVLFSQWDKRAPRIFIQEANKTGGKAAPIAQLSNKPIRKAFIYTTDTHKWREC